MSAQPQVGAILFYDAACGLCTRSVRWCLHHDRRGILRFAPLQGETFARLASRQTPGDLDTAVFADASGIHLRSEAVLRAGITLGGAWGSLAWAARGVPRFIRDAVYRFIAGRRIGWFGPADACPLDMHAALKRAQDRFLP